MHNPVFAEHCKRSAEEFKGLCKKNKNMTEQKNLRIREIFCIGPTYRKGIAPPLKKFSSV
jgi:hypothetical protein